MNFHGLSYQLHLIAVIPVLVASSQQFILTQFLRSIICIQVYLLSVKVSVPKWQSQLHYIFQALFCSCSSTVTFCHVYCKLEHSCVRPYYFVGSLHHNILWQHIESSTYLIRMRLVIQERLLMKRRGESLNM